MLITSSFVFLSHSNLAGHRRSISFRRFSVERTGNLFTSMFVLEPVLHQCTTRNQQNTAAPPSTPPRQQWDDTPGAADEAEVRVRRRAGGAHPRRHEPGGAGGDGLGGGLGDVGVSLDRGDEQACV